MLLQARDGLIRVLARAFDEAAHRNQATLSVLLACPFVDGVQLNPTPSVIVK